jgi:hypothetical protein
MPGDLKKLITDAQEEFRRRPEKALASFRSSSALQDGFRSVASLREHLVTVDEPASLGVLIGAPIPSSSSSRPSGAARRSRIAPLRRR